MQVFWPEQELRFHDNKLRGNFSNHAVYRAQLFEKLGMKLQERAKVLEENSSTMSIMGLPQSATDAVISSSNISTQKIGEHILIENVETSFQLADLMIKQLQEDPFVFVQAFLRSNHTTPL